MAKYSEDRELNKDLKCLHKVWSEVDRNIELPASLTGDALLHKLDGIEHKPPASKKIRFSPKVFTWQSGITYAAAFVLIVALSTALSQNDEPNIVDVPAVPANEKTSTSISEPMISSSSTQDETLVIDEYPDQSDKPEVSGENSDAETSDGDVKPGEAEASQAVESRAESEPGGVGGANPSLKLGEFGGYVYTYRVNDATDPDKEGFPITISAASGTGDLAFQLDIPDMKSITSLLSYGDAIAVVGVGAEGVGVRVYSVAQPASPVELLVATQPGALLEARLQKNVVHVLSSTFDASGLDCDVVELPESTENAVCLITAVNLDDLSMSRKAFAGAGDVSLMGLDAFIKYSGNVTEENTAGQYVAQVKLDGMSIELGESA